MDAARERRLTRQAKVVDLVPRRILGLARSGPIPGPAAVRVVGRVVEVGRCVEPIDLDAGLGDEAWTALRAAFQRRLEALRLPSVLVLLPAFAIGHGADDAGKTDAAATRCVRRRSRVQAPTVPKVARPAGRYVSSVTPDGVDRDSTSVRPCVWPCSGNSRSPSPT